MVWSQKTENQLSSSSGATSLPPDLVWPRSINSLQLRAVEFKKNYIKILNLFIKTRNENIVCACSICDITFHSLCWLFLPGIGIMPLRCVMCLSLSASRIVFD